jgi:uncharacterized cupin superfamily protein
VIYKSSKLRLLSSAVLVKCGGVILVVALVALALAFSGSTSKPALSASTVRKIEFSTGAGLWNASPAEIEAFVSAYREATVCSGDLETTGGAGAVITKTSGEKLWLRGGEEPYVNVYFGKHGLRTLDGKKLIKLFTKFSKMSNEALLRTGTGQRLRRASSARSSDAGVFNAQFQVPVAEVGR